MAAIAGIAFGVAGLLAGILVLLLAGGDLASNYLGFPPVNGFGVGIPALALGPLAYFLGKAEQARIAESEGKLGGRPTVSAARGIGIAATTLGAVATLGWMVIMLLGIFGTPPA